MSVTRNNGGCPFKKLYRVAVRVRLRVQYATEHTLSQPPRRTVLGLLGVHAVRELREGGPPGELVLLETQKFTFACELCGF